MNKDQFKQVLTSILIGATISFLTVLFQGLLDYLGSVRDTLPGAVAGMVYYLKTWSTSRLA